MDRAGERVGDRVSLMSTTITPNTHATQQEPSKVEDDLLAVKITGGGLKKVNSMKSLKSEMYDVKSKVLHTKLTNHFFLSFFGGFPLFLSLYPIFIFCFIDIKNSRTVLLPLLNSGKIMALESSIKRS